MSIVELGPNDLDFIIDIQSRNFSDGWNENMLKSAFDGGRFFALAVCNDKEKVGLITYSVAMDTADLEGITVESSHRKKGYGQTLINAMVERLKGTGVERILLEVRKSNQSAINLYQKSGFEFLSVRKNYYQDGEDALVLMKEI